MLRICFTLALSLVLAVTTAPASATTVRLKDIMDVEGVRDNQLIGYGLVIGLNGTGDSLRNSPFTRQSLESMLERQGINIRDANLNTRNVAAVIVTANLPAFSTRGTRIDITVSALGDAKSLEGGVLAVTPLNGADGQVYAVGQGPVTTNSIAAGGDAASVSQGVPTNGRISSGALVEREIPFHFATQGSLRLSLRNPDFATASRATAVINDYLGLTAARALNPAVIELHKPDAYAGDMMSLVTEVGMLRVEPDRPAKVVIDETSGVIVIGENVRVSRVAIAQGNLTISISESPVVSQPEAFGEGETVVVPRTDVAVEEERTGLALVEGGVSLRELVDGLNALGVSPRDLISILQALRAAGALQAEIEVI